MGTRITVLVLLGINLAGLALAQKKAEKRITEQFLHELGAALDCYFTIEDYRAFPGDAGGWHATLPASFDPRTVPDAVRELRKALPRYAVKVSISTPVVIHIRDFRLERTDYVLSKPIHKSFFQGTPHELVVSLGKAHDGLMSPNWSPVPMLYPITDEGSKLLIRDHRGTVRDLLTNYLPLSRYYHVLWLADSWEDKGRLQTSVRFRGAFLPFAARSKNKVAPGPIKDFTQGSLAFLHNHGKERADQEACRFIENCFSSGATHQVRWAMLFLGREKAIISLPLLLKHLDYRYTNHAVLRESYPAVTALAQLGPVASAACLRRLREEDDALKRKLLCQVLLDQHGAREAVKVLHAAQERAGSSETRGRFAEATKVMASLVAELAMPEP